MSNKNIQLMIMGVTITFLLVIILLLIGLLILSGSNHNSVVSVFRGTAIPTPSNTPTITITSTSTITPTPTPSPIPYVNQNLEKLADIKEYLPNEYILVKKLDDYDEVSVALGRRINGIENAYLSAYAVPRPTKKSTLEEPDHQYIFSVMMVLNNEFNARETYSSLFNMIDSPETKEAPEFGDQSIMLTSTKYTSNFNISMAINATTDILYIWRNGNTVNFIYYSVMNPPNSDAVSFDRISILAEKIQLNIEKIGNRELQN